MKCVRKHRPEPQERATHSFRASVLISGMSENSREKENTHTEEYIGRINMNEEGSDLT
jgi:hypothetical protein